MTYSVSPMATWERAVRRMPTTAITVRTTMTALLMMMFGHVATLLTPAMARTDGARTTTPEAPAMKDGGHHQPAGHESEVGVD